MGIISPVLLAPAQAATSGRRPPRRYPPATTVSFGLLVSVLVLTGVFVGNALYLAMPDADPTSPPPLGWLALPPLLALGLTTALALTAPRRLERRRSLVTLSPPDGAPALARLAVLAEGAGLRDGPLATWNRQDVTTSANAYGRPGRYRIALTPALVGAVRRRPEAFDLVVRHELGHLRNHDVLLAYGAQCAWYAVVPLLLMPAALFLALSQGHLLGEYALRAAALALLVGLIRAALLRAREHEADIVAASWSPDREAVAAALVAHRPITPQQDIKAGPRRLFALHPSPQRRADIVLRPAEFTRPRLLEIGIVGLLAGAGLWLLTDLVAAAGVAVVTSERVARGLLFGGAGTYVAAVALRAAATGPVARGRRVLLGLVGSLGVVLGVLGSPERTGLALEARADLVDAALTGALAIGIVTLVLIEFADRAQPRSRLEVALALAAGAATAGLAANSVFAGARLAATSVEGLNWQSLPFVLTAGGWAPWFGALVAATACLVLLQTGGVAAAALSGVATGAIAAIWAFLIRLGLHGLTDDQTTWRYYLACVWLIVVASAVVAVARSLACLTGLTDGLVSGAVAVVVGAVGLVLVSRLTGGSLGADAAVTTIRLAGGMTAVLAMPVAALAAQTRRERQLGRPVSRRAHVALFATFAVIGSLIAIPAAWVVVAPTTTQGRSVTTRPPGTPDSALDAYLVRTLPRIAELRDAAYSAALQYPPSNAERLDLLATTVLPAYDRAVAAAREVTGPPSVQRLNGAALTMILAEREAYVAEQAYLRSPGPALLATLQSARSAAQAAGRSWQQEYDAARSGNR